MATYKRFEDLPAWKDAMSLAVSIFKLTEREPFDKFKGDLVNQLRRAALSISNSIADGFERGPSSELAASLRAARGSAGEVRSMLRFALHLGEIPDAADEMRAIVTKCEELSRQIRAWQDSLRESDARGPRHDYGRHKGREAFNARSSEFGDAPDRRARGGFGGEQREASGGGAGRFAADRAAHPAKFYARNDARGDGKWGEAPKCPECGKTMVARKSRDGREFWGCPGYPECRGTRDMDGR